MKLRNRNWEWQRNRMEKGKNIELCHICWGNRLTCVHMRSADTLNSTICNYILLYIWIWSRAAIDFSFVSSAVVVGTWTHSIRATLLHQHMYSAIDWFRYSPIVSLTCSLSPSVSLVLPFHHHHYLSFSLCVSVHLVYIVVFHAEFLMNENSSKFHCGTSSQHTNSPKRVWKKWNPTKLNYAMLGYAMLDSWLKLATNLKSTI